MFQNHQLGALPMEAIKREVNPPINSGDPEVLARTKRRLHTVAYKLKVIETVAALRSQGNGAVGAYLRSEGLYYSAVRTWERLHTQGKLTTSNRRGTKPESRDELQAEIKRLRRQNEQLEKRLQKTELIVDLQKKLSQVLQHETDEVSGRSDEP